MQTMRTMIQSEKDLPQFEAVALIEEKRGADNAFPLNDERSESLACFNARSLDREERTV